MRGILVALSLGLSMFASLPATSNYELNSYSFGSGGTSNSYTSTYSLEGETGEVNGATSSTSDYSTEPGYIETQQANVPIITLDNNSGQYYNELHFVISPQENPSDATYLIAITSPTDARCTSICYVQPDGTLSTSLSTSDYQTYAAWGSSSGSLIVGLLPSTSYTAKARATQGKFTESAFGPGSNVTTASPSITFNLNTSSQSSPPYSVSLGTLLPGTISTASNTINTGLSTNADEGGNIYITSQNGGLKSSSTGYQINSVSNDLNSITQGFGAQSTSVSQTSGGPFTALSPYNVTGTNVGSITSTTQSLYASTDPVTAGSGTLVLKAKVGDTATPATDYQEVLTLIASANF